MFKFPKTLYFAISDLTAVPQKGSVLLSNVLKNMGPVQHPNSSVNKRVHKILYLMYGVSSIINV